MKLFVDLGTLELIEAPGFRNPVSALRFKRGDAALLEVVFLAEGTTPAAIGNPEILELHFGVKARGRYDAGYLVHASDWTKPAQDAENPVYSCSPSFNTVELNALLGLGSPANESSEVALMGEITWRVGGGLPTSTRTFVVVVENDVNRGTEGVPQSAQPAYPAPEGIEMEARKGAANGYAGLDQAGKVPAAQLAVTAAMIADSTATGRALLTAASQAAARAAIGAPAAPPSGPSRILGLDQTGAWAAVTQGQRAVLTTPYDYAAHPLPPFLKGLALYVLDATYAIYGYTIYDLLAFMESHHGGSTFWTDILAPGDGGWTVPGFAVLNANDSSPVPLGVLSVWPAITSRPGRLNPGSEVYLDPDGMAELRFPRMGLVSVHGDLGCQGGGGYGSY